MSKNNIVNDELHLPRTGLGGSYVLRKDAAVELLADAISAGASDKIQNADSSSSMDVSDSDLISGRLNGSRRLLLGESFQILGGGLSSLTVLQTPGSEQVQINTQNINIVHKNALSDDTATRAVDNVMYLDANGDLLVSPLPAPIDSPGLYYRDSSGNSVPVPLLDNNTLSLDPYYAKNGQNNTIEVAGENYNGATAFDFGPDVSVVSTDIITPNKAILVVNPSASGNQTAQAGVSGDALGTTSILETYSDVQIPGSTANPWQNAVNVTTSLGAILKNGGSGGDWDAGATFGSVANGVDFRLRFKINTQNLERSMIGFSETYVDANWTTIQYGLYFGSTTNGVKPVENGAVVNTNVATTTPGDEMEISRIAGVVKAYHKDTLIFTYVDTSTETNLFTEISMVSGTGNYTDIVWLHV